MLLDAIQARALFRQAVERRFAVLAVNADSPAAITDVLEAARECDAPVMIETSLWQLTGRSFGAGDAALGLTLYLAHLAALAEGARYRDLPVILHTDHIKGPITLPLLSSAIRGLPFRDLLLRPGTLSLDSSAMTDSENIAAIGELCRAARDCGQPLALEMEAGVDAGVTPVEVADRLLAPIERDYPQALCLWAPGVGTQHGLSETAYPFSPEAVARHRARATEICGRPIGIALHGSSGLSEAALREGIAAGVAKVNWSSESLLIRSQAARAFYASEAGSLDKSHPDWKASAMDNGVQTFVSQRYTPKVVERIRMLGGAGQAGKCKLTSASPDA